MILVGIYIAGLIANVMVLSRIGQWDRIIPGIRNLYVMLWPVTAPIILLVLLVEILWNKLTISLDYIAKLAKR